MNDQSLSNSSSLLGIGLCLCVFMSVPLQAEDVYNFYFKKPPQAAKEKKQEDEKKSRQEAEDEYVELPSDVLLVPDGWEPAPARRWKRRKVRKEVVYEDTENKSSYESDEAKRRPRKNKKWSVQFGIGSVEGVWGLGEYYTQETFVVGGRYHFSRYFDINGELQLPRGQASGGGWSTIGAVSVPDNFQVNNQGAIGIGVTPIHLNIFGAELLEIGVDGGVMFVDRPEYYDAQGRSENNVFVGPRVAINFSKKFGLIYQAKYDSTYDEFTFSSLTMAYNW